MKVGLDVRPEFEALLSEVLNDTTKIRLPAQIAINALKSLELSEHIESNLEFDHSRKARYAQIAEAHRNDDLPHDASKVINPPPPPQAAPGPQGPPRPKRAERGAGSTRPSGPKWAERGAGSPGPKWAEWKQRSCGAKRLPTSSCTKPP